MPCRISVFSGQKREKAPRENPPTGDFFMFSHGDLTPRHQKNATFHALRSLASVCRIFAWRGERSPSKNPPKSRLYDMAQISHHSKATLK